LRAVFDTNIFISAFLLPGGHGDKAYRLAIRDSVELISSPAIITEVASTLRTKFDWDSENTLMAVRSIGRVATVIKPLRRLKILSDEPDNHILECAVESGADLIVTGDGHLLRLKNYEGIPVVRLRDFLRSFPG
jgi:putative PIN family toxin of toxin-antitoxin system